MTRLYEGKAIENIVNKVASLIIDDNENLEELVLIAIMNGGNDLAVRLAGRIKSERGLELPVGYLDITVYRDDIFSGKLITVDPSDIQFSIDEKVVVLVDDVIKSGRSVRAALDGLNGFGRPKAVRLAVLIDRGGRELPIEADYVGKKIHATKNSLVTVELKEKYQDSWIEVA